MMMSLSPGCCVCFVFFLRVCIYLRLCVVQKRVHDVFYFVYSVVCEKVPQKLFDYTVRDKRRFSQILFQVDLKIGFDHLVVVVVVSFIFIFASNIVRRSGSVKTTIKSVYRERYFDASGTIVD